MASKILHNQHLVIFYLRSHKIFDLKVVFINFLGALLKLLFFLLFLFDLHDSYALSRFISFGFQQLDVDHVILREWIINFLFPNWIGAFWLFPYLLILLFFSKTISEWRIWSKIQFWSTIYDLVRVLLKALVCLVSEILIYVYYGFWPFIAFLSLIISSPDSTIWLIRY